MKEKEKKLVEEDDKKEEDTPIEEQTKMPPKKKKGVIGTILNIFAVLLFLFIIFETVIAFMNFNLIKQEKEPKYFVTTIHEKEGENEYTIHNMGLFKIVRKDTKNNFEIRLLPFFINEK